jgi:hypothetical protein
MQFSIPDNVIDGVASEIHRKTSTDYHISVVGTPGNIETPQVFEIMPFDQIDKGTRFYAIDGSLDGRGRPSPHECCFSPLVIIRRCESGISTG